MVFCRPPDLKKIKRLIKLWCNGCMQQKPGRTKFRIHSGSAGSLPASHVTAAEGGSDARQRLLFSALRLFSEQGFSQTSTRQIALEAGANIGAISYYFGDKAGLYRAAFTEPLGSPKDDISFYNQPHLTLRQSLDRFFSSFLEPLKQSDLVQQCTRLHFREMMEPTGLWAQELEHGIRPAHLALVATLRRHLRLAKADDELHRLAFAITSLALHMFLCRDVIDAIRPRLIGSPPAINQTARRLADFAQSMVDGEQARRTGMGQPNPAVQALGPQKKLFRKTV